MMLAAVLALAGLVMAPLSVWGQATGTVGGPATGSDRGPGAQAEAGGPDGVPEAGPRPVERRLILAVKDAGEPLSGAGGSPRGDYRRMAGYAGSAGAAAVSEAVAREYGLRERAAWTIAPLNLRCMLFAIAPGDDLDAVIQRLKKDERVQLAQPLQEFETFTGTKVLQAPGGDTGAVSGMGTTAQPAGAVSTSGAGAATSNSNSTGTGATPPYNDPYYGLQRGFQQMAVAPLQQLGTGARVKVAVIDTGVDARHPDLQGRLPRQRDYVGGGGGYVETFPERHGTEVLGLIAARVNNRTGIVGLAPGAMLLSYRACWADTVRSGESGSATARCNSFTLAQALGAAIADGADVINLSLGGPSDPLLTRLLQHAQARGAVVVAAAPPERLAAGFPSNVPGTLVVATAGDPLPAVGAINTAGTVEERLAAPGRSVLTTVPGGEYDMDTGSSLASANAAGVVALLRSLVPSADADRLRRALRESMTSATAPINACVAARLLGIQGLRCP
ncbi:S8 family serine peptidase [Roseateles sp. SL47]|uniref:S8 family peptidase n=1 Tax=Roseateles sp. SL47 TaxID=2995138 RepID=UPI00226E0854|nr:S8 family serine peptidase [Roseateles sp. SL47]WAC71626.1 S8 family serine peptidase [Roseateles sp. SL47]